MNGNNQQGFLLIEFLVVMAIVMIMGALALPSVTIFKKIGTKQEMQRIKHVLVIYEIQEGSLPNNLNQANQYFEGTSYKKDEYGDNYIYNKTARTLCTSNIQAGPYNYCVDL